MYVKEARTASRVGCDARGPAVDHHDDASAECPCSDCRLRRFQQWRVALESGWTVERGPDGAWRLIAIKDAGLGEDDDLAA
ncbi:MAG: hypothetical protein FJZ92_11785 [Chloroflexi bacterium]|nr:hypothetical protein [Chloroflexota bacterium]